MKDGERMSTVTAKIQILVTENQAESLRITSKAYQKACNWLSEQVFNSKNLNQVQLNNLYYKTLREQFGLKSQLAQSVMKTVIASYKSAKSNHHPWSQVVYKHPSYDLVWNRDYSLNERFFSINTLGGRLKLPYVRKGMKKYFNGTWKFGTAKMVYKHDKWFLHIPMTKEIPTLELTNVNNIVGVDLGINFLATTYDSKGVTAFYRGRTVKHKRGKFKAIRKQLQQCQTASARKRLKAIGQRENRYVTDVNHQITKALVENYPKGTLFVLEDLTGVRNATEKVRVKDRYVSVSWAYFQFRQMLEYKALLYGHQVIAVPPQYTSQTCPKCGHVNKANRCKKTHTFTCKNCSYQSNDDRIGAMNLYLKGLSHISTVTV